MTLTCFLYPFSFQRHPSSNSHGGASGSSGDPLAGGSSAGGGAGGKTAAQPKTLEELLERQWEQGSQFLMEQASHFDSE